MQTYTYEARTTAGHRVHGTVEAETERNAIEQIHARGYWALKVKAAGSRTDVTWYQRLTRGYFSFLFHRVNSKALAIWYRSFADLLGAGMNIYESALTLSERTGNRTLRAVAAEIAEAAHAGKGMSPLLDHYPTTFPVFARALIETGEETGLINDTLEQLASFYEALYELEMSFRVETFYPKILLVLFILIPSILPAIAGSTPGQFVFDWRIYFNTIAFKTGPWVLGLVGFWLTWRLLMYVPPVRSGWHRAKLLIPGFGGIVRRLALVRWARALAMMLRAGVPLRRALEAASSATGNQAIESSLLREMPRVVDGEPLSAVMTNAHEFPAHAVDMVVAGERSGNIEQMLDKLAQYYEIEATTSSKKTAMVVGTAFYLAVAAVIGIFVISYWMGYYESLGNLISNPEQYRP